MLCWLRAELPALLTRLSCVVPPPAAAAPSAAELAAAADAEAAEAAAAARAALQARSHVGGEGAQMGRESAVFRGQREAEAARRREAEEEEERRRRWAWVQQKMRDEARAAAAEAALRIARWKLTMTVLYQARLESLTKERDDASRDAVANASRAAAAEA